MVTKRTALGVACLLLTISLKHNANAYPHFNGLKTTVTGNDPNNNDFGSGITTDSQGKIFVIGGIYSVPSARGIWIGKYDQSLGLEAQFTLDGSANGNIYGSGITADSHGNVFATGSVTGPSGVPATSIWIAKFDSSLVLLASTTVNGSMANGYSNQGGGITVDNSGNVFVTGTVADTGSPVWGNLNIWVGKYDSSLVFQSSTTINGYDDGTDFGAGITHDNVGNIYVAGGELENLQDTNIWIAKFDSSLVVQRQETVNGPTNYVDEAYGITMCNSGNIYVTGTISEVSAANKLWVGEYNSNLLLQSSTTIDSVSGTGISCDAQENIYLTGKQSGSGIYYAKLNSSLVIQSSSTFNSGEGRGIIAVGVDNFFITGTDGRSIWISKHQNPTEVTGVQGTVLGFSSVTWTWNDAVAEDSYQLFSSTGGAISPILSANTVTWTETGLTQSTTYYRFVKAVNYLGYSSSTIALATTLAPLPTAPSGFTGVASGPGAITWSWNASSGQDGYQVFSSTGGAVSPQLSSTTLSWMESGLVQGTPYTRYLGAFNATGSTASGFSTVTTPLQPSGTVAPRAFPSPLRPDRGETVMTFANLSPGTKARIFTLSGELVDELSVDGAGMAFWFGRNRSRENVAGGVYFAVVEGNGGKKVLKIAVQR